MAKDRAAKADTPIVVNPVADALHRDVMELITQDPVLRDKAHKVVQNSWHLEHLPPNVGPYQMLVVARLSGDEELLRRAEEVYVTSFPGRRYPEDRGTTGPIAIPDGSVEGGYVRGVDAILRTIDTEAAALAQQADGRADGKSWAEGAPKKGSGFEQGKK